MENKIQIGDKVDIHFSSGVTIHSATVKYIPGSVGDNWVVETEYAVIHVGEYAYIEKSTVDKNEIPF